MTKLNITEAGSVQFPMVRPSAEIGWLEVKVGERSFGTPGDTHEEEKWKHALWELHEKYVIDTDVLGTVSHTCQAHRQGLGWL